MSSFLSISQSIDTFSFYTHIFTNISHFSFSLYKTTPKSTPLSSPTPHPPIIPRVNLPVRYSREQIYRVVADVDHYADFVPFCTMAHIEADVGGVKTCTLEVGFPPVKERYTSYVTSQQPYWVKVCFYSNIIR